MSRMGELAERLQGRALRDDGIARAAKSAEHAAEGWRDLAVQLVRQFAKENDTLTSETAMDYAYARGLSAPPEPRAWGAVVTACAKAGWIVRAGFEESRHARAHSRPVTVWRSLLR